MSTADVARAFQFSEYNLTWSILVATSAMYKNNCKQFEVLSPCRKKFDTSFLDFDIVYSHSQFLTIYIMTEDGIHDQIISISGDDLPINMISCREWFRFA